MSVCFQFKETGSCKFGDACHFPHVTDQGETVSAANKSEESTAKPGVGKKPVTETAAEEGEKKKKKKKKRKKKKKDDGTGAVKLSKRKLKSMEFLEKHGISIRCYKCKRAGHQKQDCPGYQKDCEEVKDKICFQCREIGHVMEMCPLNEGAAQAEGADDSWGGQKRKRTTATVNCYNCGSDGHPSRYCPEPKTGNGVSFAMCFICKERGHLSSQCAMSKVGIYPHGGSCHLCQSIYHLAKDCPKKLEGAGAAGEDDQEGAPKVKKQKKKEKVVSF